MPTPRRLRGNVAEILNPMVREGLILGFRTDLFLSSRQDEVVIAVLPLQPDGAECRSDRIRRALAALPVAVTIRGALT